ncbi:hypothetical protein [Streptomyces chumphonensis]|uniref:hypothetical protein n=1 Tax=Streptomyces chumphonensis TaxID=1214925 RepID=UPI003D75BC25
MSHAVIAQSRTAGMTDRDGSDFMTAYYKALAAHRCGRDLDEVWVEAWRDRETPAVVLAGLVEGFAAARKGAR